MIAEEDTHILFIEPKKWNKEPVIDGYTRRMVAAVRLAKKGGYYMGYHTCYCGAEDGACDLFLPNGQITNSLALHYLMYHREDVPAYEIYKVSKLEYGEEEPTQKEKYPGIIKERYPEKEAKREKEQIIQNQSFLETSHVSYPADGIGKIRRRG